MLLYLVAITCVFGYKWELSQRDKCLTDYYEHDRSAHKFWVTIEECAEECKLKDCALFAYKGSAGKCWISMRELYKGTCEGEDLYRVVDSGYAAGSRGYDESCDKNEDCQPQMLCQQDFWNKAKKTCLTTAESAVGEVAVGPFGNNDGGYKKQIKDEPVLVKRGVECKSSDKYIGKGMELRECALRVYYAGGDYLVYGTGNNAGWCYLERTSSESCPEGWEVDDYDFYKLTAVEYVYNEETALAGEPHESAVGEKKVGGCDEYPEDCETGTAATVAMTSHQPGSVSVVTYGFATVGLGFLVYGAGKYYLGKRDSEMQAIV